ncbi:MAG TPA: FixH family protein [Telluria sp.]|nr:FixH family protein [Telluria sp.]
MRVTSAAGQPVQHARIGFDGGMPQHHHGFPTSPRVTEELGEGRYRLDGMKFSMTGWWELKLTIDSAIGADKVAFNTVIEAPAACWRRATRGWRLPPMAGARPPPDRSNAYERSPAAAALDKRLFFAFETPGLRNVALRPPYMHAGQIATLDGVVRHYASAPQAAVGRTERKPVPFTEQEMADPVNLLGTLSGPISGAAN